jgi:hypothetical protein
MLLMRLLYVYTHINEHYWGTKRTRNSLLSLCLCVAYSPACMYMYLSHMHACVKFGTCCSAFVCVRMRIVLHACIYVQVTYACMYVYKSHAHAYMHTYTFAQLPEQTWVSHDKLKHCLRTRKYTYTHITYIQTYGHTHIFMYFQSFESRHGSLKKSSSIFWGRT